MAEADWHELRVAVHGRPVFVRMGPEIPGSVPLVHVHGFAVSGSYLLPTARALAHRATTVVPDLPGYGKSSQRIKASVLVVIFVGVVGPCRWRLSSRWRRSSRCCSRIWMS